MAEDLVPVNPEYAVMDPGANIQDVKQKALDEGMLTLRRCGLLSFMRGMTSLEEVLRCTMAD